MPFCPTAEAEASHTALYSARETCMDVLDHFLVPYTLHVSDMDHCSTTRSIAYPILPCS